MSVYYPLSSIRVRLDASASGNGLTRLYCELNETAKLNQLDPEDYLRQVLGRVDGFEQDEHTSQ
jgi:hypothetical protein